MNIGSHNPLGSDGSIDGVRVTGYNRPHVLWKDRHGAEGKSRHKKGRRQNAGGLTGLLDGAFTA